MTARLRETFTELGRQMPPARLTGDVWRRGRRARRRARLIQVAVAGAVVALTALLVPAALHPGVRAAAEPDAVPARLSLPWMWQATVQQSPPGPASVLFGGDSIGLNGSDLFDSEGKLAVVGRGGDYRTLLYGGFDAIRAGEEAQLSPDGTRVASAFLETERGPGLIVTDLTTGASRAYPGTSGDGCCSPVAWAPDGRGLLAAQSDGDTITYDPMTGVGMARIRPVWLDLDTGQSRPLGEFRLAQQVRTASAGAVSPDGTRVVVTDGPSLRLATITGETLWTVTAPEGRYLAGAGAFTPDGTRIAVFDLEGCRDDCDEAALAARRWRVSYLDALTGAATPGPVLEPVTGLAVRALGWTRAGELVALRYQPQSGAQKATTALWDDTGWYETGHVTLIGLRPGGGSITLLDPPDGVLDLDVARDLLEAGRFGGASPDAAVFPARSIILLPAALLGIPLSGLAVTATLIVYVVRRRRGVVSG